MIHMQRVSSLNTLVSVLCKFVLGNVNNNPEYSLMFVTCTSLISTNQRNRILASLASSQETLRRNMKRKTRQSNWAHSKKINLGSKNLQEQKLQEDKKLDLQPSHTQMCIDSFNKKIREGPYFICTVCSRCLYRRTVVECKKQKYSTSNVFTNKKSFNNKEYICKTCNSKVSKGQVPCQAVCNKLMVDEIPPQLQCLEKLEQIFIAQRIFFEKIVIMSKGQQKKIKGAICNVPVSCDHICTVLPRPPEMSGIIMLKLKRKLVFKGHVYFKAVRPDFVLNALQWLKQNNPLYANITIMVENVSLNLTQSLSCGSTNDENKKSEEEQNELEENDDPLNNFRMDTNETCLQPVLPDYPIDGENNTKLNMSMTDKLCEELPFPVLFPNGTFGHNEQRSISLSPSKYFNARLLHYSGRFA